MKLPRDISGVSLARALNALGYEISRQSGSHIRLTTIVNGEHHVTVPAHDPIKIGTLSGILADIARHHEIGRDELLDRLGL
ncbi:MAG TPA: type II toxin-antitoxin system HicA family toxin [Pyrinomonadaceae bacterium]|nr:type II toxin-antitoxin system HicA family toxin [Acidobacteriota bacterium]HQZ95330.1 type II toxin-antitoxin system HicA family toxin [Pyrinomonadaceae bacterium]